MAEVQYKLLESYPAATQLNNSDVLPVSQGGVTRKLPGSVLQGFVKPFADAAAESANTATTEANYLRNLRVTAASVPSSTGASVTKTGNQMTFRIPQGKDGNDGKDFVIIGYYASLSELQSAVTSPTAGAAYGVGTTAPYNIYIWDGVNSRWVDNGTIQGPAGPQGQAGPAGPNEVSIDTASSITGILKGSSGKLAEAVSGTDYLAPSAKGVANGLASLDGDGKVTPGQASAKIVSVTANKTLVLTDAGTLQKVNSSNARTITIPTNSSAAFPVGTEIEILRYGSGDVTISPESNVTIRCAKSSPYRITDQYGGVSLKKLAANEWLLMGNLG